MCTVIMMRGLDDAYPVVVAANRDEARDRAFSPPGLSHGARRRWLSPKDKRAGGTWIGINDRGMACALTNVAGEMGAAGAPSRGELPHLALDHSDPEAAIAAVGARTAQAAFAGFRIAVASAGSLWVGGWVGGQWAARAVAGDVLVFSNEAEPGDLPIPELDSWSRRGLSVHERVAGLEGLLIRDGAAGGTGLLKRGESYGTVSSSVIAIPPAADLRALIWRFAAGSPDACGFRNYGNLGRRLVEA